MKPKILIFSLAYFPHVGGAEVAIKEITDRIGEHYDFHLICNRYDSTLPKTEKIGSVTVHRIGFSKKNVKISDTFSLLFYLVKILYVPLATLKAISLHRKHSYDAFWSMMLYMSYPVALVRLFGIRKPAILTLQEGDTFERVFNRWYIKMFEPILLRGIRKADVIQSISTFLADWVKVKGFAGRSVVIPNAVNTKQFSEVVSESEIQQVRKSWGVTDSDTVLVTTSRLVKKNGIDTVIEALPKMLDIHFVVYGTGPEDEALRTLANKLKVSDRVHFLGQLDHAEMPKHLQAADIFIRPSRSEGMGNSFIEAMAAGVPVIATQEGGIADFLFDAEKNPDKPTTGWAVSPENPDDITRAVELIAADREKTGAVTAYAKQMVIDSYDWDLIAQRMKTEVFDKITKV